MQHIMAGAQDITSSLTGGSLAGLVQIRDQEIPGIGSSLDQLAAGLSTALNNANAQGYDLETPPVLGGNIFSTPPTGGVGAAAAMTVTMTDPSLLRRQFRRFNRQQWKSGQPLGRCQSEHS